MKYYLLSLLGVILTTAVPSQAMNQPKVHLTGEDIETSPIKAPLSLGPVEADVEKPKEAIQEVPKPEVAASAIPAASTKAEDQLTSNTSPSVETPAAVKSKPVPEENTLAPYIPSYDPNDPLAVEDMGTK